MQPKYRYRKIAKKLTEKYLQSGAEFELSINTMRKKEICNWVQMNCKHLKGPSRGSRGSYSQHSSSQSKYSSQSEYSSHNNSSKSHVSDQLYHLFEDCRKEIYFLMANSVDRYVKVEAYKKDKQTNLIINNTFN